MSDRPYLSIVVTSRNDDHGGDLLGRMQTFLNSLAAQVSRFNVPIELLIVEWNPPTGRPRLRHSLDWRSVRRPLVVRIVEVPVEIHAQFRHADQLPLFQMIAKNVGIRRSQGEYVLASNIDILFPNEFFAFLSRRELQPGVSYRVDRADVSQTIMHISDVDERLELCRSSRTWVAERLGMRELSSAPTCSLGIRGVRRLRRSISGCMHILLRGLVERQGRFISRYKRFPRLVFHYGNPVHTNACGDFTLLARSDWERLRGYPEMHIFSLHIDSWFLYVAHFSGITERMLSFPVYHIEHSSGWSPSEERAGDLFQRLLKRGVPWLSIHHLRAIVWQMLEMKSPIIYNDARWGLSSTTLAEEVIDGATAENLTPPLSPGVTN